MAPEENVSNQNGSGAASRLLILTKGPSTYYVILFTVKCFMRVTFFQVNRVEHQVEFLVFNSAFSRWLSLNSAYYIMITIYFLRSLKKLLSKHSQFSKNSFEYTYEMLSFREYFLEKFFPRSQKIYNDDDVHGFSCKLNHFLSNKSS